jgi:hypothetical protein
VPAEPGPSRRVDRTGRLRAGQQPESGCSGQCHSQLGVAGAGALAVRPADAHAKKPTVVLEHGAFADSSGWNAVVRRLQVRTVPGASHMLFVSHAGTTAQFIEKAARETVR